MPTTKTLKIQRSQGPPTLKKKYREMTPQQQSQYLFERSLWRREHLKGEYAKLRKMILSIRKRYSFNQLQLAQALGVSLSSVKRWEYGWGYHPRPETMTKLIEFTGGTNGKRSTPFQRNRRPGNGQDHPDQHQE
jgi:DNA-binding transcriptional regulator YiaG